MKERERKKRTEGNGEIQGEWGVCGGGKRERGGLGSPGEGWRGGRRQMGVEIV